MLQPAQASASTLTVILAKLFGIGLAPDQDARFEIDINGRFKPAVRACKPQRSFCVLPMRNSLCGHIDHGPNRLIKSGKRLSGSRRRIRAADIGLEGSRLSQDFPMLPLRAVPPVLDRRNGATGATAPPPRPVDVGVSPGEDSAASGARKSITLASPIDRAVNGLECECQDRTTRPNPRTRNGRSGSRCNSRSCRCRTGPST